MGERLLTEKLDILEARVRETVEGAQSSMEEIVETVKDMVDTTVKAVKQGVEGAQSTVEEIVETVRETVGDTVETVKRTVDVQHQVDQHPWLMVGGATLAGYLLGNWGGGRTSPAFSTDGESSVHPQLQQPQQGLGSSVLEPLKDEIAIIKVAAVGALVSTLREMVNQVVPTLAPHMERALSQRSGQPIESPPQQPAPMSRVGANGGAI
jgi:ElaB/YqjD/DUF883 family membrane-anchored ribosome-binding protein